MKLALDYKKKKNIWIAFVCFSVVVAVLPLVLAVFRNPLGCDSAYYLTMIEMIGEGKLIYKDFGCGYTPLFFYMMAFLKKLFQVSYGNYEFYTAFFFVFQLLCAFFTYKICRIININKYISYIVSWWFILQSHYMQGNAVLLEIPSMMFGMWGIYLIFRYKDSDYKQILSGLVLSCAMLCKQYGLGYFLLGLLLIVFVCKKKLIGIIELFIGFSLPCLLCILIWKGDFIHLFFSGYGTVAGAAGEAGFSVVDKLSAYFCAIKLFFTRYSCIIPVSFIFIKSLIRHGYFKVYLFCLCGILGFLLQLCFAFSVHYMLYTLPFVSLIIALLLSLNDCVGMKAVAYASFGFMLMFALYSTYNNRVKKIYIKDYKLKQQEFAAKIKSNVPEGKTIWIVNCGLYQNYYLTNLKPPYLNYSFGPAGLSENDAEKMVYATDFVLSFEEYDPYEAFYTKKLRKYVWEHEMIRIDEQTVLHKMR